MALMDITIFALFSSFSETCQWRSAKLLRIYVAQVVLMHILVLGDPAQFLQGGKNCNFGQNFRQGSQMLAYYSTTGKSKNNMIHHWLSDYTHPKVGGGQLSWTVMEKRRRK